MCYNDNWDIRIETCVDGQKSVTLSRGGVEKTLGAVRISYGLDGDRCVLTVRDGEATQIRRGEQNIEMRFQRGTSTNCRLESEGFVGSFEIFTHELTFEQGEKYALRIGYSLGGQNIALTFTAERIN